MLALRSFLKVVSDNKKDPQGLYLYNLAEKASESKVFILSDSIVKKGMKTLSEILSDVYSKNIGTSWSLDLPFESCWFEWADPIRIPMPDKKGGFESISTKGVLIYKSESGETVFSSVLEGKKENSDSISRVGLISGNWSFLVNRIEETLHSTNELDNVHSIAILVLSFSCMLIGKILDSINDYSMAKEDVDIVVKSGPWKDTTRIRRKISEIIFIEQKKIKEITSPLTGRRLPCSYRFAVRGHWRVIKGIGKNSNGHYCESGRTWVKDHEKGSGELIEKVRIIK